MVLDETFGGVGRGEEGEVGEEVFVGEVVGEVVGAGRGGGGREGEEGGEEGSEQMREQHGVANWKLRTVALRE